MFLLVVQFMMQIKLNFSNFIFYGTCLPQLGGVPAAYAVVAGGCDWPIQLWRHFDTFLADLTFLPFVALAGNPALYRLL